MDAAELARWQRFAAKGGIGKCTAIGDCVAEAAQDLMFLKNDEIVVLMQLPEDNLFLGYCEGIVGRFHANDVHFHSKLKKPVMTKRSSVGGTNSGKSTPTQSFVQSPSPSLVQSPSPRSGISYQTSPSPSQLRYQPPPSPPLSPSSSRERIPRNASFSSTTVSGSVSVSTLSSGPDTPLTVYSSSESIKEWPKPLDASTSSASMDTNVSGRSSTYLVSTASINGLDSEGGEVIDERHNRRSETTTVEIWPSSPASATIARKPVNGSRLALTMEPPTDSEESDEDAMENGHGRGSSGGSGHEEEEYDPDGGWATHHYHGGTLPLQVVKLSPNPNSVPPSPYRQTHNDHESTRSDSRPDSVNHNDSSRSTDSESNYNDTESEDNANETARFSEPVETSSPSPSNHGSTHHPTSSFSDSVRPRTPSSPHSTHNESFLYDDTTNSLAQDESTRSSIAAPSIHGSEDGEVGIGLSLLQGLQGDDASDSDADDAPSANATPQKDTSQRQSALSAMRGPPPDEWDGASIYENYYRFSRFSTNPRASTSTFASAKMQSRSSHAMPAPSTNVVPPVPVDLPNEPESDTSQAEGTGSGEKRRSVDSDASVYTQASKVSSIDPSRLSVQPLHNQRRPSPLELTNINGEPSPLLHTRWGSPASSVSPPTSSPANQTSFSDGTPPASASSGSISPGGVASQLRQRLEIDRASPIGSYTKLDPSDGEGLGGGIVIEDDEDAPAPSTVSITSDPRTESPEEVIDVETGDETMTKRPALENLAPLVIDPLLPPVASTSANASPLSTSTPTSLSPSSPPDLPPPAQTATPSHHQPRPSLSELRGYAPNPSMDQPRGQRTSMFLPHPNAPKAPPATGAPEGPLYIRQPPPPSSQRSESAQTVTNVINMSVGRSKVTRVMPTIYGRTELDLGSSTGPVRIVFSMDPLPPLSAPLPSQIPFRSGVTPTIPPPPGPGPAAVPRRMTSESEPGNSSQPGSPVGSSRSPIPRGRSPSATASPASTVGKSSPLAEKPITADPKSSAPIPRPNFFPKAGTSRPRSRSFSGFNTPEISLPSGRSREEGAAPLVNVPIKGRSMSTSLAAPAQPSPSPSPLSQNSSSSPSPPPSLGKHASRSSLRSAHAPSPLSLPQNNSVLGVRPPLRSPTSPLAGSPVASGGSPPGTSPRPPHQLRQAPSRSTLNDRPTLARNAASDSPTASPVHTRNESLMSNSHDRPSLDNDSLRVVSPSPGGRESLRSKLSLPNLRRNQSRTSLQQDNETVQVEDMDFELVRPNLAQFQQASGRSSEDSSFGARDASVDGRNSNIGEAMRRTDSPAMSVLSGQTPWSSSSETSIDAHRQRELKWVSLMGVVPPAQAKKNKKVKKLLMDGSVPSSVRFLVWSHLTDGKAKAIPGVYAQLGKRARGLTLIAGHLLVLSPEEDAFWIFVSIMDSYLRPYFSTNTTQVEVDAALFSRTIEANDVQVAKKILTDMSVDPVDICRTWFSTLFVDALPLDYLNRVWDLFLFEGIPFLFRVGLALLHCCRQRVLEAINQDSLLHVLNHPSPNWLPSSPDAFVALAYSFKVKDDDVRKQRIKMEAQIKRQTQNPRANPARTMSHPRPAPP
ncbi:Rab-GAP TBC domain-containing protein [Mycena sanguinolenta]|uniref:Rab-GAP TBC domain-containing protein n=1 Tax=Mycena sanguinolenta TaxID=230812 RepID=A0A8H6YDV2_9AGAR|nr:Rab-GAP TBC domain-containing protein [Mycena sanguinolenta]